ncbi:hypothetical protein DNTS_029249 [Danionella cerebrum]|uniref:Uncharacterized protein n=1 Tax=Danionella cerebrum TaxID=2873325 RepID=A0A553QU49_9TELE|nr:hypothetical protein DNTS_029249 [Danionella translucida]
MQRNLRVFLSSESVQAFLIDPILEEASSEQLHEKNCSHIIKLGLYVSLSRLCAVETKENEMPSVDLERFNCLLGGRSTGSLGDDDRTGGEVFPRRFCWRLSVFSSSREPDQAVTADEATPPEPEVRRSGLRTRALNER